jgi:hypothetical protein
MDAIYRIGAESFHADRKIFYRKHPDADKLWVIDVPELTV